MADVTSDPGLLYPLNLVKRSFTEIFEGKLRFVYRLILTKKLDLNEKLIWDNFIVKQKHLFNVSDNSQSNIFIAREEKSKDFILNILRSTHYSEERFLKGEFDQNDCDSRFISFAADLFKQYVLFKRMRDFKPKEELKIISFEELGLNSGDVIQ